MPVSFQSVNLVHHHYLSKFGAIFYFQHPAGVIIHPSGVERSLHDCINALRSCYGDKRGRKFRVWLDVVSTAQMSSDTWVVKFDKWESTGKIYTIR